METLEVRKWPQAREKDADMDTTVDVTLLTDGRESADFEPADHWPRDILEAYARYPGPYTFENAETILEEEPVELYNGWLVWQEMTDVIERRAVATIQDMLSISARNAGFGQALPDQLECLLSNGDTVKPDASLVSWARLETCVQPTGPHGRPTLQGGPELVIEVRSPSNWRAQERRKRGLYFENGVQIVWDVDEERQIIWVYRAEAPDEPIRYDADDEIDCEPLLPGWRRRVGDMFAARASAETVVGEVADRWRAEGIAEGAAKTLRRVLPRLVRAYFGVEPPADLPERLASCDLDQLEALEAALETCDSLDEWLTTLPDTSHT
jgi:Uma2 family endonuclease